MLANNVILGPWAVPFSAPQDESVRDMYTQNIVGEVAGELFDMLAEYGFDVDISDELDYTKDIALMVECIRSFIMKRQHRYHPAQEIAENIFEYNEDGRLYTLPELILQFKSVIEP